MRETREIWGLAGQSQWIGHGCGHCPSALRPQNPLLFDIRELADAIEKTAIVRSTTDFRGREIETDT